MYVYECAYNEIKKEKKNRNIHSVKYSHGHEANKIGKI